MDSRKVVTIFLHALVGWALCSATMGIGMATLPVQTALIVHAIAAPIYFAGISLFYFHRFHYTSPLATALCFVGFVMAADFVIMALLVLRSFAMFASLIGTWIPFALIFLSTYLTGLYAERRPTQHTVAT
jgi:hypothetical protein